MGTTRSKASGRVARACEPELSVELIVKGGTAPTERSPQQQFADLKTKLLADADGGVSLTEAAALLGMSRQGLHMCIMSGAALGVMDGDELVLPRLQWVGKEGKLLFVDGLSEVIRLFDRAGGWSALQFLVDPNPNLGIKPIEALHLGKIAETVSAARGYLGLDEG